MTSSLVTSPSFCFFPPPPLASKELRHGQQGPIGLRVNPEFLETGLKSQKVFFLEIHPDVNKLGKSEGTIS